MSENQIELSQISKTYGSDIHVLKEIDLEIKKGEFFVLVGPSGSGKSTLLRMIAGLEDITSGIIKMEGEVVNHLPPKNRNISMVFQNYALYPHLNVKENILFGLRAKGVKKEEQIKRLSETAQMIGLDQLLDRKPKELSGGQRQRVALARSVVSESPICLMDEPLSNLDAKLRAHMRMEIKKLHKNLSLTMVYVTHDQVEAMTMGDRIMVLDAGKIQQVGKPIDLYNEPSNLFVASFIGSPKMNIAQANYQPKANELKISNEINIPINNEIMNKINGLVDIKIGIRPEHILISNENDSSYEVRVSNVEQLGNETHITFELNETFWTAKWSGQFDIKIGEKIHINIIKEKILVFDGETGILIKNDKDKSNIKEVV